MTEPLPEDERIVAEDLDFPPAGAPRGPADLSRFTLHMVGHAHIDLGYRWNQGETVHYVAPWTFRGVLELMARTPGFTFCQSQLFLYEAMRREYPELLARIRAAIDAGRWEVIGGAWCEYDAILPSGEAVIRQHLHGVRYAAEQLGVSEHRVAFFPDSFCGHAATLPQILAGCGFRYYVFGRGLPQDPAAPERTRRAFRWIGPDGSELIAYLPFGPYSTPPLTPQYLETCLPYARAAVAEQELVLYGEGDHGGGPRDREIEALRALTDQPGAPRWQYSTVHGLCAAAFTPATVAGLREYRGNLDGFATGALTSQARIKRRNRQLEKKLLAAEATAVIGTLLARKPAFPRLEVRELWRRLLTEQFHDILPGTSVAAVYRDTAAAYDRVDAGAEELLADGFARVRTRLDTRGDGVAVVIYNPGLLPAAGPFRVPFPVWLPAAGRDPARHRLVDAAGRALPFYVEDGVLWCAGVLPPLAYQLCRWIEGEPAVPAPAVPAARASFAADTGVLECHGYRATFDMSTGDLVGLEQRATGRALLAGPSNVLELTPEMAIATSWVQALQGPPQRLQLLEPPHVVAAHALFTRVATVSRSAASVFRRDVTLHADQERVDFRLAVDWHEGNAFLKVQFAPALAGAVVRTALAHGATPIAAPEREFCCHDFVDLRAAEHGLALLNDGAYGCRYAGGHLGLSVLRTVRDMDPQMAHGAHELRYALYPYEGAVADAVLLGQAAALEERALGAFEPPHPGGIKSWGPFDNSQALPPQRCFVAVSPAHVVLCAFKLREEDWAPLSFVVRVRETAGQQTDCSIELPVPVSGAVAVDHLERPLGERLETSGRRVRVPLGPLQLRTLLVSA